MFLYYGHACLQIFIERRCNSMSILNVFEFHVQVSFIPLENSFIFLYWIVLEVLKVMTEAEICDNSTPV